MSARAFLGLALLFCLGCLAYSVQAHGWGVTIKGLAIFWGVYFGTILLMRLNVEAWEWRQKRQEVQR